MSSQGAKSNFNDSWQTGIRLTRDSSDWTSQVKRKVLYLDLKANNTTNVNFNILQSFDLNLDYNYGGVLCEGCTGGAGFPLLNTGS
jgi:hypothetical protein